MQFDRNIVKDNFYEYVMEKELEPYFEFREKNEKLISPEGISYYEFGSGPVLLCLPGSTGKAMTFYQYFEGLSAHYRIIAIDYPVVDRIEGLTLKLMQFLRTKDIDAFYIFANSFGTVVAQSLLWKLPVQCKGVVLTHAVTKTSDVPKRTVKTHQKGLNSFIKSIRFLNFSRFQSKFAKQLRKNINIYQDDTSKRLFWEGLFIEMLYDTTKEEMMSNYGFMKDFWQHFAFDKAQFQSVTARVILMEAYTDHEANMPEKYAIRSLLPNVEYVVLPGEPHLSLVKNKAKIQESLLQLLKETTI